MRRRLEFFVAMLPRQKNALKAFRFGATGVRLHYDKKTKEAEATLASRVLEHRPTEPFSGPVRLDAVFVMPVPAGFPQWKRAAALAGRVYPAKRPDRGNLLKLLEDALTGPFVLDDSQFVAGNVAKIYGTVPGYRLVLEELDES